MAVVVLPIKRPIRLDLVLSSKEAHHVIPCPPPFALNPTSSTQVVPLDQLWSQIPLAQRQEVLRQLTQMMAQRLAHPARREAGDE